MIAKKCDRCGKFYEHEKPKLMKIGNINTYGIAWELHFSNRFIDLCPRCIADFIKWFEEVE